MYLAAVLVPSEIGFLSSQFSEEKEPDEVLLWADLESMVAIHSKISLKKYFMMLMAFNGI